MIFLFRKKKKREKVIPKFGKILFNILIVKMENIYLFLTFGSKFYFIIYLFILFGYLYQLPYNRILLRH